MKQYIYLLYGKNEEKKDRWQKHFLKFHSRFGWDVLSLSDVTNERLNRLFEMRKNLVIDCTVSKKQEIDSLVDMIPNHVIITGVNFDNKDFPISTMYKERFSELKVW